MRKAKQRVKPLFYLLNQEEKSRFTSLWIGHSTRKQNEGERYVCGHFGRPGCPYCVRAKEHAETLKAKRDDFNYRYVDIHPEGITKADQEQPSAIQSKPFHRFSSMNNTSAAALTSKRTQKKI